MYEWFSFSQYTPRNIDKELEEGKAGRVYRRLCTRAVLGYPFKKSQNVFFGSTNAEINAEFKNGLSFHIWGP